MLVDKTTLEIRPGNRYLYVGKWRNIVYRPFVCWGIGVYRRCPVKYRRRRRILPRRAAPVEALINLRLLAATRLIIGDFRFTVLDHEIRQYLPTLARFDHVEKGVSLLAGRILALKYPEVRLAVERYRQAL